MSDSPREFSIQGPPRRRRRLIWRVVLSLILVASGAVIGSGLTVLVLARELQIRLHHPELFAARATGRLQRFLDLSDDQARQVESILSEHQKQIQSIRRECQPRFERQIDEIRTEISAVLKPEQARKWESWLDDKRRTWLPPVPQSAPGP